MASHRVADRYARAVAQLAHEQGSFDAVVEDFKTLHYAIERSRDLQLLLASPVIDDRKKESVLAEIFTDRLSPLLLRFLMLLAQKGRAAVLPSIVEAFYRLLDSERGIQRVTVRTAVELDPAQQQNIRQRLESMSGRGVSPTWVVDPALIGGFIARFEDRMIDASVRHQLERLRESFVEGSVN